MGRKYDIPATETAHSAAGPILQIASHSSRVTRLLSVDVTQNNLYGDANAAGLRVQIVKFDAAMTGGTTLTARPKNTNDAAFGGTAISKPTTGTPTATVLVEKAMNIQAGFQWTPPDGLEITIGPSEVLAIRFPDAPAASIDVSCQAEVEELP